MSIQIPKPGVGEAVELGPTFLGLQAHQLLAVIDVQGTALLATQGIELPSRAVSTLSCLLDKGQMSVTGLAQFLDLSHQLVRHRLKDLKTRRLISESHDPADRRKTVVSLTRQGREIALRIKDLNCEIEKVYLELFDEIGTDLFSAIIAARQSLLHKSLYARVMEMRGLAE